MASAITTSSPDTYLQTQRPKKPSECDERHVVSINLIRETALPFLKVKNNTQLKGKMLGGHFERTPLLRINGGSRRHRSAGPPAAPD